MNCVEQMMRSVRNLFILILLLLIAGVPSCAAKGDTVKACEGYITIEGGLRLYYRAVGDGADTVIVPAAMYLAVEFERLAKGRTLIFYDMRNRGRSDAVSDTSRLGMNYEISDLEAVRKYFGVDQVSLIGWSYLGAMVVLYAMEYPGNVKRVIQVGPIPPRKEPYMEQFWANNSKRQDSTDVARLDEMRQLGKDKTDPIGFCREYWEAYLKSISYNPDNISRFHSDYYTLANEMPDNVMFQFSQILESLGNWDWRASLANLRIPVLNIHGDFDTIPMEAAREWVISLPMARLFVVPNAGHLPFVDNPEPFFHAVESFLGGESL